MAKIKLTKGELKKQRDALKQYQRYLPTLQLKKQQLQMEIVLQGIILADRKQAQEKKTNAVEAWAGLLTDEGINIKLMIKPKKVMTGSRNIAGVDLPLFERLIFEDAEYDLFLAPLWVDSGLDALKELVSLRVEAAVINQGINVLRDELRVTTQRVNLFEKIKIPESEEAIRLIKIYIGDQMTNAVGRSKAAKRKIEETRLQEVAV